MKELTRTKTDHNLVKYCKSPWTKYTDQKVCTYDNNITSFKDREREIQLSSSRPSALCRKGLLYLYKLPFLADKCCLLVSIQLLMRSLLRGIFFMMILLD